MFDFCIIISLLLAFKKLWEGFQRSVTQQLTVVSRFLQGIDVEDDSSYRRGTFRELRISKRQADKNNEDDSSSSDEGESCFTKYNTSSMKRKMSKQRTNPFISKQQSIKEEEDHDVSKLNDEEQQQHQQFMVSAKDLPENNLVMPIDYSFKPAVSMSAQTGPVTDDGSSIHSNYLSKLQNDIATNNTSPTSDKTSFVATERRASRPMRGRVSSTARSIMITGQWVMQHFDVSTPKKVKELDWKTLLQKVCFNACV